MRFSIILFALSLSSSIATSQTQSTTSTPERQAAQQAASAAAREAVSEKLAKEGLEKEKRQLAEILKSKRGTKICLRYSSENNVTEGNIEEVAGNKLKIISIEGKSFWDEARRWYVCGNG